MKNYYHLPIYKEAYGLCLEIFKKSKTFSREYRHSVGERLKGACLDMLKGIYLASYRKDASRVDAFDTVEDALTEIRITLRLLRDLGEIGESRHMLFTVSIEKVSKQLHGWKNA